MEPFSCQPLFDRLTHIAVKSKVLEDFAKQKTSLEKVQFCWNTKATFDKDTVISFRKEIQQILEVLYRQSSDHKKSDAVAAQVKEKGLKAYLKRKDTLAHQHFTDCLRYAPEDSPIYPIAYGNRSAVLFQMGRYKEALEDIERAERKGYPNATFYKLLSRQCSCHIMLGERTLAEATLESCKKYLASVDLDTKGKCEKIFIELEQKVQNMSAITSNKLEEDLELPNFFQGESQRVTYMSDALDMRVNDNYGRHVVAAKSVPKGSVVFVEKPYASILLPEHHRTHCHNCFDYAVNPIPCPTCVDSVFCTEECCDVGMTWHQYECGILHILSAVGIAHLALRVIFVTGWRNYCTIRNEDMENRVPGVNSKDVYNGRIIIDGYRAVFHLMPHLDNSFPEDQLQYCLAALLLSSAVLKKTSFADQFGKEDKDTPGLLELNLLHLATAIMRHIAQLVANAHAITQVVTDDCGGNEKVEEVAQKRIATAIYPTASLMNHSCKPNIINSFFKNVLVIRTIQDVEPDEQIYNCYGPHCFRQTFKERQDALRLQYFFTCNCAPCTLPQYKLREAVWSGFHCETCGGVASWIGGKDTISSDVEESQGIMACLECHRTEKPSQNLIQTCTEVSALQDEAEEAMLNGDPATASANLRKALTLGSKVYLEDNHFYVTLRDTLAKILSVSGDYENSCQELRECLRVSESRYGSDSVELGHELLKFADVLSHASENNKKLKAELQKVKEKTNTIFSVIYGPQWRKYLKV